MSWPKSVPYLEPKHLCQGKFIDLKKEDCKCSAAWLADLFGFMSKEYCHATKLLRQLVNEEEPGTFYSVEKAQTLMGSLLIWNDQPQNDPEYLANTLNALFRRLGYVVYTYE